MKRFFPALALSTVLGVLSLGAQIALTSSPPTQDRDEVDEEDVVVLSPFEVSASTSAGGYSAATTLAGTRLNTKLSDIGNAVTVITSQFLTNMAANGNLGATVGGAQDINFFRDGAGRGLVPHPDTFTAEGLFSEYDLPLDLGVTADQLFVVQTAAVPARFDALPEVVYLAQLGFSSGLTAATWQPPALNLVAVVDKSGSMNGQPLALVRASLTHALGQMRDGDQLSIVLYGDQSHVFLPPTRVGPATRNPIAQSIASIASSGSTNMEAGLAVGYQVARESAASFTGNTRMMLFTDEQPNVGNTSAQSFMSMAEAAAHEGIGLTTIGVGVQFGVELATKVSGVRGGNLFFFPNVAEMVQTFADDFDTMVTELAHDFSVRIAPESGYRIAGVFGLPADTLQWEGNALTLDVATLFLSKRKGAIYFALAPSGVRLNRELKPANPDALGAVARIDFSYREAGSPDLVRSEAYTQVLDSGDSQLGLTRGRALVDEFLSLRQATTAHVIENDSETAWRTLRDLSNRLDQHSDPVLDPERALVRNLHDTVALLSGHHGELRGPRADCEPSPLAGAWHRHDEAANADDFLVFWPDRTLESIHRNPQQGSRLTQRVRVVGAELPTATHGTLSFSDDRSEVGTARYTVLGEQLNIVMERPGTPPQHLALTRSTLAAVNASLPRAPVRVDPLSGLPDRHRSPHHR